MINRTYYSLFVLSLFSLVSDLNIIRDTCNYDVISTNNSWYSVIKTSRLQVIVFTQILLPGYDVFSLTPANCKTSKTGFLRKLSFRNHFVLHYLIGILCCY